MNEACGLNEVRPRRPEQSSETANDMMLAIIVSMKSGLEGRNNPERYIVADNDEALVSMKSGLEGRNNPAIVFLYSSGQSSQ